MRNIIRPVAALIIFSVFAGCEDAAYQAIENGLYINEAASTTTFNQQVENLTVADEVTVPIHIRVAQPLDNDVNVTLALASDFVKEYNAMHGTSYQVLPDEYLDFEKQAVIKAGTTSSDPVEIRISPFSTPNGEAYCVPLKIESADTDIRIMEATSRIMYLLTGPLIQKVPLFNRTHAPTYNGASWGIGTDEWTLETWFNLDKLGTRVGQYNNQAIFAVSCSEGTEIYVRFGDAAIAGNILQVKTGGSQFELTTEFEPNKWYHLALTYSASGEVTAYVNGEKDGSMTKQSHYVFDNITLCGSGSYFVSTEGKMAQIRFWSKCLAQSTIKANMNRAVDPNSSGLIGYWKLDDGEGNILKDSSPNGFDLECQADMTWSSFEVDFTDPNASEE